MYVDTYILYIYTYIQYICIIHIYTYITTPRGRKALLAFAQDLRQCEPKPVLESAVTGHLTSL